MSKIKECKARQIVDSRADWTIEVQIFLESGISAKASVPQGKSTGSREDISLPAMRAVMNVNKHISQALQGLEVSDQPLIDKTMLIRDGTPNESNMGANAILGVSMACARVAAKDKQIPLWKHLRNLYER